MDFNRFKSFFIENLTCSMRIQMISMRSKDQMKFAKLMIKMDLVTLTPFLKGIFVSDFHLSTEKLTSLEKSFNL